MSGKGMPLSIPQLLTFLVLIWRVFMIIWDIPRGDISDRLEITAKVFLNLPNLLMLIKPKSLSLPRNLVIVFSTKLHPLYLLYPMTWRCCLMHLIKQNCLLKSFLRTLILITQAFLYPHSLLELIWNYIMFIQLTI